MSLAELLVSLAMAGLLLAAATGLLGQGQRLHAWGAARVETQQAARIALERMAREIRQAGQGGAAFAAVSVAEGQRIVIHFDLDGDGVLSGSGETVTWLLRGRTLRRNAGGGAQPIINGVRALELSYLDAAGLPTAVPADVRTVIIALAVEPDRPGADPARRAETRMATAVRLRNR